MSEEQLKAFLEKVKADPSLQKKLKAAGLAANQQAVLSVASEASRNLFGNIHKIILPVDSTRCHLFISIENFNRLPKLSKINAFCFL